jgi:hypothetical protein
MEGGAMIGKGMQWATGMLAMWLLSPVAAEAGWLYDWCNCQKPSYHKLNYIVPNVDRFHAFHCRVPIYTYARDLHPDIPLHYQPVQYKCPPAPPGIYVSNNYPWFPQEEGRAGYLPPPPPSRPTTPADSEYERYREEAIGTTPR